MSSKLLSIFLNMLKLNKVPYTGTPDDVIEIDDDYARDVEHIVSKMLQKPNLRLGLDKNYIVKGLEALFVHDVADVTIVDISREFQAVESCLSSITRNYETIVGKNYIQLSYTCKSESEAKTMRDTILANLKRNPVIKKLDDTLSASNPAFFALPSRPSTSSLPTVKLLQSEKLVRLSLIEDLT